MNDIRGDFFSYKDFRRSLHHQTLSPKVWTRTQLTNERQALASEDVDIVALTSAADTAGCEVAPGMAMAMQWLNPGVQLKGHAHAWWHLFIIQSGRGYLTLGDAAPVAVGPGDVLLVPAWNTHGFDNIEGEEPLAMLNLSNMPQMALLSNFADSHGLITTPA
ncbi:cupin domain-containing protein [Pseudomonas fluorescens]|jgi:gentisate 1,2-dioxygenase|uniref:cupin domain-containing protein n=1 Tax=Pseudomonas fluorescens TaxID=294 RepID=UPI002B1CFCFF|nr:cupin domain-containing protein [Pseudomonas fluorescens]